MNTTDHTTEPTDPTAKVRRDLAEIIDLSASLFAQAVNDANATIDGTSLPGGRAMIALALVNDAETFERRVEYTERAWFAHQEANGGVRVVDGVSVLIDLGTRPDPASAEDDDTAPALQILRYWSEQLRWELGMVWDHIPTLITEASFLRNPDVLTHAGLHHADTWQHMTRDINRSRTHLESILHAGRRPDRSRVVCNNPTCTSPRELIKVYAHSYVTGAVCSGCATAIPETRQCVDCSRQAEPSSDDHCHRLVGRKDDRHECGGHLISMTTYDHCPNPWCFTTAPPELLRASQESEDRWKCTNCKKRYDTEDFASAHAAMLRDAGAERFVSVREAIATLVKQGRPEVTVRSWLKPPRRHVADRCRNCKREWTPGTRTLCACGGDLRPVRRGNANDVIESYCDIATHQTLVWWPDMWRRHLVTKAKAEQRAARATATRGGETA